MARHAPPVPPGMIVVNAHRLTDASGEAFLVRLYRGCNATCFVRAVSDQPTAFTSGFNKVRDVHGRVTHPQRRSLVHAAVTRNVTPFLQVLGRGAFLLCSCRPNAARCPRLTCTLLVTYSSVSFPPLLYAVCRTLNCSLRHPDWGIRGALAVCRSRR